MHWSFGRMIRPFLYPVSGRIPDMASRISGYWKGSISGQQVLTLSLNNIKIHWLHVTSAVLILPFVIPCELSRPHMTSADLLWPIVASCDQQTSSDLIWPHLTSAELMWPSWNLSCTILYTVYYSIQYSKRALLSLRSEGRGEVPCRTRARNWWSKAWHTNI